MAKKKSKKQHKSASVATGSDNSDKKRQEKARRWAREYTKKVRSSRPEDPRFQDGLDYDEIRVKRRISATVALLDEAREKLYDLCPDVPDLFSFEEDWYEQNLLPVPAYDYNERFSHSAMAAAIWILDQLRDQGAMWEVYKHFPRDERVYDDMDAPDIWDASHDDSALMGMLWIIQNRNEGITTEERSGKKTTANPLNRVYMDLCTAQKQNLQKCPGRLRFESTLAMIPPEEIEKAVDYYIEKFWDVMTRWYKSRRVYVRREMELDQEDILLAERAKALVNDLTKMHEGMNSKGTKPMVLQPLQNPLNFSSLMLPSFDDDRKQMLLRASQLDADEEKRKRKENELMFDLHRFTDTIGDINTMPYSSMVEAYGDEVAQIWKDFTIEDPYSIMFGFLYLLDQNYDLPWLYQGSVALFSLASNTLPWRYGDYEGEKEGIWDHYDDTAQDYVWGYEKARLPKRIKLPEMENWYAMDYVDHQEQDERYQDTYNLSQVIYEITGGIMPRNLNRYETALLDLERYGITGKKATHPLLYCMTMLGEVSHRSRVFHLSEKPTDSKEPDKIEEGRSTEELEQIIKELRQENKMLQQTSHDIHREAREAKRKMAELEERIASERQELTDLRELVFNQQEEVYYEDTEVSEIAFPYTAAKRIVVFGGHYSWAREIKQKLPNVRFIDRTMQPNAELIRRADVVWIQTNSLSHSYYYKIIDEVRKHHVPVRYFSYASATKCAEQVVEEDQRGV